MFWAYYRLYFLGKTTTIYGEENELRNRERNQIMGKSKGIKQRLYI